MRAIIRDEGVKQTIQAHAPCKPVNILGARFFSCSFKRFATLNKLFSAPLTHGILSDLMVLLLGSHRRSQIEILCGILEICSDGAAKTGVVYRANLNFTRLNEYMNTLLGMGYVSLSVVCREGNKSEMKIVYNTTEQGKGFLANFVNMQQGLKKFSDRNRVLAKPLISRSL